jgi:hypothetical protein
MNAGRDVRGTAAAESAGSAALCRRNTGGNSQQEPGAKELHELPPAQAGPVARPVVFTTLRVDHFLDVEFVGHAIPDYSSLHSGWW